MRLTGLLYLLIPIVSHHCSASPGILNGWLNTMKKFRDVFQFQDEWISQQSKISEDEYDFIIVGSGSAGSVIANRLSEVSDWKVLLLEVGKGENLFTSVPALAPVFQLTHYNWNYLMEYQENFARGMEGRRLAWPRGRALGGTSVINYMIYTRGNPRDFDTWAIAGNPGWSYYEVLPYYLKSERCRLQQFQEGFHNDQGLLGVENIYHSNVLDAFIAGGEELGYDQVDYNSDRQIGFSRIQANVIKGRRNSVAKAFLHPIRDRPNLRILTSALATKIIFAGNKAVGVEYTHNFLKFEAKARKEVIVCAGALASPQLMMLSGIGPRAHLNDLNIPVIADLPVGRNLHDHITYVGLNFLVNSTQTMSLPNVIKYFGEWAINGTGFDTSLGGVGGVAYIKTEVDENPDPSYPDMELLYVDGCLGSDAKITAETMRISEDSYNRYWRKIEGKPCWTIFPMLVHPKSIGYMELRSRNPTDHPKFYGNYLSDERDLRTMIAAIRFILTLAKTSKFKEYHTNFYDAPVPGCEYLTYDSDEYWQCAIETFSITLHHQVGTCKMGPNTDPEAVVNHNLQVYGVSNLRVADTSVIPKALTAHTNAPSIMVGEKASDIIKAAWGRLQ
ncbi:PREDICTED: glucose dehydrogenase [FAD, quinone]-like [Nicrophorus vespilloides]|uniref:Glucose dehydrogenase [FAD, quinone]-like n=1 Tax=Nicrophorus vespilloides TaxID=110193 RepID=A0ABM1MZJ5_NICVS|nr:PREDICTED: glucose dehydrogenase [FAD, quinone]-like [Nicrophorus vespilloides]